MAELNMEAMTRSLQQRVSEAVSKAVDEHLVRQAIALAQLERWHEHRNEDQAFYEITRISRDELGFEVTLYLPEHEQSHAIDGTTWRRGEGETLAQAVDAALAYLNVCEECGHAAHEQRCEVSIEGTGIVCGHDSRMIVR